MFSWFCEGGTWRISPAYDLTYSDGIGHMQTTAVPSKGNPTIKEMLALAREVGLPYAWTKRTAEDILRRCSELLMRHAPARE